jgi:type IV pilus assembly protein PilB
MGKNILFKDSNALLSLVHSSGYITSEELKKIEYTSTDSNIDIVQCAMDLSLLDEIMIADSIASSFGLKRVDLKHYRTPQQIDHLKKYIPFSKSFTQQNALIPFEIDETKIKIAIYDPTSLNNIKEIKLISKLKIEIYIATITDVQNFINTLFGATINEKEATQNILKDDSVVIRMIDEMLNNATKVGASDIHLEPYKDDARLRFRIDGILEEQNFKDFYKYYPSLVTRIKILANLNIAEKRLPQDGHIESTLNHKNYEFRISVLPTNYGERVVMRILDKGNIKIPLEDLGLDKEELEIFSKYIKQSKGMILVTGATGSGKTTTLYAALNKINHHDVNILTIEDPIEYSIKGIGQVQINEKIGVTFSETLRSFLRQDPDKILVGEMRDKETADIAIKAALTGHLVLSTLHTNDAISTIDRLLDMRIEPFLITSSLLMIVSQRLARKICEKCKVEDPLPPGVLKDIASSLDETNNIKLFKGKGCEYCNYRGSKGRVGIFEVFQITPEIKGLILAGATSNEIRKSAIENDNFQTLKDNGLKLLLDGKISLNEYHRVLN